MNIVRQILASLCSSDERSDYERLRKGADEGEGEVEVEGDDDGDGGGE